MPSFTCKCGARLDIGNIPNANEWLLISDIEYDKFPENLDAEALYKCFQHMLKCPQCQRLWIFGMDSTRTLNAMKQSLTGKNTDNSMKKVTFIYQIEDGKFGEEDVWASSCGANYKVENIPFFYS